MRAQITARFSDSLLEVVELEHAGSYRIGAAPDVDLAVANIGSFPIVTGDATGFVVRTPVGMGDATDVRLVADQPVTLRFGMITITIELVARAAPLPLPKVDLRPYAFLGGSLIVHLLVWGAAVVFAHAPIAKTPRPRAVMHPVLAKLFPAPPPPVPHPHVTLAAASRSPPVRSGMRENRSALDELAAAAASTPGDANGFSPAYRAYLKAVDQHIKDMLDAADPLYVEEDAAGFGKHGGAFDPTHRAGWGTIATGRYQTISSGHGVGDDYHLDGESYPELALCESPHCEIAGALDKDAVQHVIAPQVAALANCVGQDSLTLTLEIAANGHVTKVHGHGKIARCAANVIGQLAFPEAAGPTTATYTIGYP
ncbi:MAG: hypothetical protein ABI591_06800 [Kofleriaceae bacterium]